MTLQAMYPALVNSPFTELAQAIDHEQTTIEVLDGSKLPDAPNIATIGNGEDAETILYAQKDGNVLSEVTRGFQATPKAWGQGTSVARMFTAYDYDTLRINLQNTKQQLDEHKAENVAKVILVTEPYDQLTKTTINLGFKPKLIRISSVIMDSKYESESVFGLDSLSYVKYNQINLDGKETRKISGGYAVYFWYDSSNYIRCVPTINGETLELDWTSAGALPEDTLVSSSSNRRLLVTALTHGE